MRPWLGWTSKGVLLREPRGSRPELALWAVVDGCKLQRKDGQVSDIKIKTRALGPQTEVQGFVGDHEVLSVSSRPGGAWLVGSSSCLPPNFEAATVYLECMKRVFDTARQHGAA